MPDSDTGRPSAISGHTQGVPTIASEAVYSQPPPRRSSAALKAAVIWRTTSTSSAPTTDMPVRARSMRAVPSSSWARGMATPAVVKAASARKRRRSTSARPRSVAARTGSRSAGPSVSGACRPISVRLVGSLTVAEWLDRWLAGKRIRKSGISRYETDVRVHLKPHIDGRRLDRLRVSQLSEMFTAITDANAEILEQNAQRRAAVEELAAVPWKGLENRARSKARKAAIGRQIITFNPAAHVEIDPVRKPKALVWTDERVARWQQTGEKPSPVMVWTPEQTGAFLDFVAEDRLYAMWHLIAYRGLRRGEACGQPWSEPNLDRHSLTVTGQLVQDGWEVEASEPKTDSGFRVVALDDDTVDVLERHRKQQEADRAEWGSAWIETGLVFTQEDGSWLHPGKVTDLFERLVAASGRHQDRVGHSRAQREEG